MKKFLWLCAVLCAVLCACGRKTPAVTTDVPVTTEDNTSAVTTTGAQPPELSFTTQNVTPSLGRGIAVSYAVLQTGDADLDALFRKAAESEFARYIPNASSIASDGGSAEYTAEMTSFYADDTVICATFSGEYALFYEDSTGFEESGDVFYTVLVDPAAKKLLTTADIVGDFAALQAAFADGKFTAFGAPPYADDLSQYRTEYGIYPYVSLDADYFYLFITESGMDGYTTEYSISRADADDFLKY